MSTWIIPAAITVASFAVAVGVWRQFPGVYERPPLSGFIMPATIVSLASWLVWSLL